MRNPHVNPRRSPALASPCELSVRNLGTVRVRWYVCSANMLGTPREPVCTTGVRTLHLEYRGHLVFATKLVIGSDLTSEMTGMMYLF
jgi:hypothetical protein